MSHPQRLSRLFDGEYFRVVQREADTLSVQCMMCGPGSTPLRTSARSSGNILKHIKRRHDDMLMLIRAQKNIKCRGTAFRAWKRSPHSSLAMDVDSSIQNRATKRQSADTDYDDEVHQFKLETNDKPQPSFVYEDVDIDDCDIDEDDADAVDSDDDRRPSGDDTNALRSESKHIMLESIYQSDDDGTVTVQQEDCRPGGTFQLKQVVVASSAVVKAAPAAGNGFQRRPMVANGSGNAPPLRATGNAPVPVDREVLALRMQLMRREFEFVQQRHQTEIEHREQKHRLEMELLARQLKHRYEQHTKVMKLMDRRIERAEKQQPPNHCA